MRRPVWLGNLALAAVALAVCAGILEAAARVWVRSTVGAEGRSTSRLDPRLGWSNAPGTEQHIRRSEFDVTIRINAQGLRGPERDYAKPAGVARVLILGDSFAEGYYVAEEDSARARLEEALNGSGCGRIEVLNAGVAGYSTDQELLLYRLDERRYAADVVVVFFFGNDLYYNTAAMGTGGRPKPYFNLTGRYELSLQNMPVPPPPDSAPAAPGPRPWRGSMALRLLSERTSHGNPELHARLARWGLVERGAVDPPLEFIPFCPWNRQERWEVDDMWNRTAAILKTLSSEVAADGGRLAVLYVPYRFEVNDSAWDLTQRNYRRERKWEREAVATRLLATCRALGIPVADPREALRRADRASRRGAYFAFDGHWNEVGNATAAAALAPLLGRMLPCPQALVPAGPGPKP